MFGLLLPFSEKLSEEDKKTYEGYYCGLCHQLREQFGKKSSLILQYDCVFLALLRNGLYEKEESFEKTFCGHKLRKVNVCSEEGLRYAADMNLLLAYQNYRDRVHDGQRRSITLRAAESAVKGLSSEYAVIAAKYPRQAKAVAEYVEKLEAYEDRAADLKEKAEYTPDIPAKMTGDMLAEILVEKEDEYAEYLRRIGRGLGAFIYLADAFTDIEKDLKTGDYNPYLPVLSEEGFAERIKDYLTIIAGRTEEAFEMLPLFRHREILRNILYSGMWTAFEKSYRKEWNKGEKS